MNSDSCSKLTADDLITKAEAARLLGGNGTPVSIGYVGKLLTRKRLPRIKLSYKTVRIPRSAVEEFIRSRTYNAKAA